MAHAICMHVVVVLRANGTDRSVVKLMAMDCNKDSIAVKCWFFPLHYHVHRISGAPLSLGCVVRVLI